MDSHEVYSPIAFAAASMALGLIYHCFGVSG